MNSCLLPMAVMLVSALSASPATAEQNETCWDQGFSCANLVYQRDTYPYPREPGSYLYVNGGVYPYETVTDNLRGDSTVRLPNGRVMEVQALLKAIGLETKTNGKLVPVIGYGSNPAPAQIERKLNAKRFQGDVVVPVIKGTLKDFDVTWTPVFVSYGSMPSTLAPSQGTVVDLWVTWLDEETLQAFDGTEHANPSDRPLYVNSRIKGADYAFEGPDPENIDVFLSCFGPLTIDGKTYALSEVPAKERTFEAVTSPEAMMAVKPKIGWDKDVLSLLYDNVISDENRATRSAALKSYGALPVIPGAKGLEACKESWEGAEKPY